MKCSFCKKEFLENEIQESHDVPCYLFLGYTRNERKNKADKFFRRWLCYDCHEKYERELRAELQKLAQTFALKYFGVINE